MPEGYPGLEKHWTDLQPENISTVLVPLCGKSVDLLWLSKHADAVTGVEVSEKAILEFMEEHNRDWTKEKSGKFVIYKTGNIKFWCGDFMALPARKLPRFDLIYDKAALVALPPQMRKPYAGKILELSNETTTYLLHHFIYNQNEMNGPPFSVSKKEISEYFGAFYDIRVLNSIENAPESFPKFVKRGLNSPLNERFLLLEKR